LLLDGNEEDRGYEATRTVRDFYERYPFPGYEGTETLRDLVGKGRRCAFTRLLDDQVPYRTRVLEAGCGTGQLSNFLGVAYRQVIGADLSLASLWEAERFRRRGGLSNVGFCQMDLFRPAFRQGVFSLVICSGVLHHTHDPYGGFRSLARLVAPGGHVIVGLYNRLGRLGTDVRRMVLKLSRGKAAFVDPRLHQREGERAKLWFADQYHNPYESRHGMGEVLRWFDRTGFDFIGSVPRMRPFGRLGPDDRLFAPTRRGGVADRLGCQMRLLVSGAGEGGLFLMIGRRRGQNGGEG
jgi:SAM-dependent methyltransferase